MDTGGMEKVKLKTAINKLNKHGYIVTPENVTDTHFVARKTVGLLEKKITFMHLVETDRILRIRTFNNSDEYSPRLFNNLTQALVKNGDITKVVKVSSLKQVRKILLTSWIRYTNLSTDELVSMQLFSVAQVRDAMAVVFPVLKRAMFQRMTRKMTHRRDMLEQKTFLLWESIRTAFATKFPNQQPLREVYVSHTMPDASTKQRRNVSRHMAVFANSATDASNALKMMLGEFVTCADRGIVAVGSKADALAAYTQKADASSSVKEEQRKVEQEIKAYEDAIALLKSDMMFLEKKMEVAQFIDSVTNMHIMSNLEN
jgi:hypothetical protein